MPQDQLYGVFLAHNSKDKPEVEALAIRLTDDAGLKVFLDKWELPPGRLIQGQLEDAILKSGAVAVCVGAATLATLREAKSKGSGSLSPWQNEEVSAAIQQSVERGGSPVIPVILPSATDPEVNASGALPLFLKSRLWVDFRTPRGLADPQVFETLVAGISGQAPGRLDKKRPSWLKVPVSQGLQHPTGVAVAGNRLLVADHEAGTILSLQGEEVKASYSDVSQPHHLIARPDGTVLATDTLHNRIVCLDRDLKFLWEKDDFGGRRLARPHGLASNHPAVYHLLDSDNNRLLRMNGPTVEAEVGGEGTEPGQFSIPCGVATGVRRLYVADTYNHRIQVFDSRLTYRGQFGQEGEGVGQMLYPVAVAVQGEWVAVSDEFNRRLQLWRVDEGKDPVEATCVATDLCAGWLGSPFGVTFADKTLYVADRGEGRVLAIDFDAMLRAKGFAPAA